MIRTTNTRFFRGLTKTVALRLLAVVRKYKARSAKGSQYTQSRDQPSRWLQGDLTAFDTTVQLSSTTQQMFIHDRHKIT